MGALAPGWLLMRWPVSGQIVGFRAAGREGSVGLGVSS